MSIIKTVFVSFLLCSLGFARHYSNDIPLTGSTLHRPGNFQSSGLLMPSDTNNQIFGGLKSQRSVIEFYRRMNNKPVWFDGECLSPRGDSMIRIVQNARYYGLMPQRYHMDEFVDRKYSSSVELFRTDALLTDAFFCLAKDLRDGRLKWREEKAADTLLISLLMQSVVCGGLRQNLESQEPSIVSYLLLKKALGMMIDSLSNESRMVFLRGYTDHSSTIQSKIQTVEINIERWRWEKHSLESRYITINVPSFLLEVVEDDAIILESKVIVGTPSKRTPVLTSTIECFVIYPYWHVPRKIAVEEYLPVIKKDVSFIYRNNFDVLDRSGRLLRPDSVRWQEFTAAYFPVTLRQREGPENSLGVIKFIFDNPYSVFLHDTNAKGLFRSNIRAFSHGCIRMERAVELAHYLTTGDISKRSNTVDLYLQQKQRHTVNLSRLIPIYVRYFTCEFKDGVLFLYDDIYDEDRKLLEAFYK